MTLLYFLTLFPLVPALGMLLARGDRAREHAPVGVVERDDLDRRRPGDEAQDLGDVLLERQQLAGGAHGACS